jgi:ABC-2 type transport system ATP-binding protein
MGKTILISSHILSELGDTCDRIGIIEHGKLLASGDHRRILDGIRQTREVRILVVDGGEAAERVLRETPGAEDIQRSGNELQFQTRLPREQLAGVLQTLMKSGVTVLFFEEEKGSLEDVFLHLTKGGL